MLQSLISLEDDQIELVLSSVTQWCEEQKVPVNSEEGRRAILVAVSVIANHPIRAFAGTFRARLNPSN